MGKGCGGHGGLNILPQKSWNVYNWDNREKVAADEAKFEDEQRRLKEKDVQMQRDARRNVLLQRSGLLPLQDQDSPDSDNPPSASSQHVLLFQDEENAAATKRLQEAAIAAGPNPNIDKMFQLGYGCDAKSEGKVPWYAQSGSSMLSKVESDNLPARIRREKAEALKDCSKNKSHAPPHAWLEAPAKHLPNKDTTPALPSILEPAKPPTNKRKSKRSRSACSSDSSSSGLSSSQSDSDKSMSSHEGGSTKGGSRKHSKKKTSKKSTSSESKHKRKGVKEGRRRKDRRGRRVEGGHDSNKSRSSSALAQLRAERLQREIRERGRQVAVVTSSIVENAGLRSIRGAHAGSKSKKYHSGFGNAPPARC